MILGLDRIMEVRSPTRRAHGYDRRSAAVARTAYPKVRGALLAAGPTQVLGNLGVGPHRVYGCEFLGQGLLGEEGMELPMAGGAQRRFGAQTAAFGARDQVMRGETRCFPAAKLTALGHFCRGSSYRSGAVSRSVCQPIYPWDPVSKNRQPGRSTFQSPSSRSMGNTIPGMSRPWESLLASCVTPKGKKAKACTSST